MLGRQGFLLHTVWNGTCPEMFVFLFPFPQSCPSFKVFVPFTAMWNKNCCLVMVLLSDADLLFPTRKVEIMENLSFYFTGRHPQLYSTFKGEDPILFQSLGNKNCWRAGILLICQACPPQETSGWAVSDGAAYLPIPGKEPLPMQPFGRIMEWHHYQIDSKDRHNRRSCCSETSFTFSGWLCYTVSCWAEEFVPGHCPKGYDSVKLCRFDLTNVCVENCVGYTT